MELGEIEKIILLAAEELNLQQPDDRQLELSPDTQLFGKGSRLDSLGLVNLIVMVEEKIMDEFNAAITVADERAMSQKNSPFRTIRSLSEYVLVLVREQQHA
jgi:acyl carrier protein